MERSRVVLFTLICVWSSGVSGAEVEMRVNLGDDILLHSDCGSGHKTVWFRNCSHRDQPSLKISAVDFKLDDSKYYTFVWNPTKQTVDLLVKNVSESDLGLYYCALQETRVYFMKNSSGIRYEEVYLYGNRTTRLSLLDTTNQSAPCSNVPDCSSICWRLMAIVCPVCVLLSSLLSSTCVYCIYRTRNKVEQINEKNRKNLNRRSRKSDKLQVGVEDELCYASLDLPSRGKKRLKTKKREAESSDFSTYSEVKTDRM